MTVNSKLWSASIQRQLGKSMALAAAYGGSNAGWSMGNGSKRFDDMRQIGGKVQIHSESFHATRKLFVPRGKAKCLLYVKNARKRFEPLCVDGTLSSGRRWKDLEIPDDYRRTDVPGEGGHVTVMNIVDAARERILTGGQPTAEWNGDWVQRYQK